VILSNYKLHILAITAIFLFFSNHPRHL